MSREKKTTFPLIGKTVLMFLFAIGLTWKPYVFAADRDSDLPGILKYAEAYEGKKIKAETPDRTLSGGEMKASPASVNGNRTWQNRDLRRRLQQRERALKQAWEENQRLQKSVADLKKKVPAGPTQASLDCTDKKKQQTESEKVVLTALKKQIQEKENHNRKQQVELETCLTSVQEKEKQTEQVAKNNQVLTAELAELKKRQSEMPVIHAEELNTSERQQTYAAGVMLGRDIRTLQETKRLLGLKTDNRILIAGLNDSLNNRVLLNGETLERALMAAEEIARKATLNVIAAQKRAGATWLTTFRKGKGVKQAKSGFWYRLDYAGDGELIAGDSSTIEVVLTEKLTDGTVVEDMDARGRSLSMALGDFPPLFREALMLMKNHGTMTLVAPPELAYGDEGYPPRVPPGATMVYTLRVENVNAVPDIILSEPRKTGK
ncbi:TPA: FKBP-type peptidyl-prolyl cis-trans isomerase, partial [Salmonella enterica subsp. enterica serovar Lexington]